MRGLTLILLASALTVCQVAESQAQGRGGQQGGLFGSRNMGGGGLQAGSRSFSGANQQSSLQSLGDSAGLLSGNERFIRDNRQAGQVVGAANSGDFVGATGSGGQMRGMGGMSGMMGMNRMGMGMQGMGMNRMGMMGGMGMNRMGMGMQGMGMNRMGMMGGMGMNRMGMGMQGMQRGMNNRFNQGNSQAQPIRTTVEVGFSVPAVNSSAASQRLTTLLQRSPQIANLSPIEVEMSGRTAILRGTVASAAERDLAQRVVLLEPGVSQVKNELVVAGQNDGELPLPARPAE